MNSVNMRFALVKRQSGEESGAFTVVDANWILEVDFGLFDYTTDMSDVCLFVLTCACDG